ncbi:MAG: family 43 glycosylhydrolase [Candidatus Nanopelagicales bacterium]
MPTTYCNPLNLGYGFAPAPNFAKSGRHRATADPCIAVLDNTYYLFSTNQWGYWWSTDMAQWHFVPRRFLRPEHKVYDDLCAPAIWVQDGALHVIGSTYTRNFPIWRSSNPREDDWTEAIPALGLPAWDPAFLLDDDGRLFLYHGSGNDKPIYGRELHPRTFAPIGQAVELLRLHPDQHGWERFGEYHDNAFLSPFIEGAWMTKHAGRYYLQYGAPGTEFSGYADGVYVSDDPLGPFEYQDHNPLSLSQGGFARGAGHGGTHRDLDGNHWHVSTVAIGVKNNFERRIGMWPAGFDAAGRMYCNTAYGDYPIRLPDGAAADHRDGRFAGMMLLSAFVPATASSSLGPAHTPAFAVDESMRTWWSARTCDPGEWLAIDLGADCSVMAVQVNFADQDAEVLGHPQGLRHRYLLECSQTDQAQTGQQWSTLMDRSSSQRDTPHDYAELDEPIIARHLRITNVEMPTGKFALMGLRVFGIGPGDPPAPVEEFIVLRAAPPGSEEVDEPAPGARHAETSVISQGGTRAIPGDPLPTEPTDPNTPSPQTKGTLTPGSEPDRRGAWIKWRETPDALGHVVYWGVAPDALYSSVMVYASNEHWCATLDRDRPYWFAIEAFNPAGLGQRTAAVLSP